MQSIFDIFHKESGASGQSLQPQAADGDGSRPAAGVLTLAEQANPAVLLAREGYKAGGRYRGRGAYTSPFAWLLYELNENVARLQVIAPLPKLQRTVELSLSDLKKSFEVTNVPDPVLKGTNPVTAQEFEMELLRCELFRLMHGTLLPKYAKQDAKLQFLQDPTLVVARESCGKGKLRLFPFTDSVTKIGLKAGAGASSVEVTHEATGCSFWVSGPSSKHLMSVGYWCVMKGTTEKANLKVKQVTEHGWRLPVLENTGPLQEGDILCKMEVEYESPEYTGLSPGPAKKKQRRA